jgi:hypothetical protein
MTSDVKQYRCLLMSPSDVAAERESLFLTVSDWNTHIGKLLGARIDLVRWETHGIPDLSGKPQEVLNHQIVDACEIGIALFWSRLGTPTDDFASGTVEEIHRLRTRGRHVMVYFKNSPIPQSHLDTQQYDALQAVRRDMQSNGLVGEFDSIEMLKYQVLFHLTSPIVDLLKVDSRWSQRELIDSFLTNAGENADVRSFVGIPTSNANGVGQVLTPEQWQANYTTMASHNIRCIHTSCMWFESIAAVYPDYQYALDAHRRQFLRWYNAAAEYLPTVFEYMPPQVAAVLHAYRKRIVAPTDTSVAEFFAALTELRKAIDSGEVQVAAD